MDRRAFIAAFASTAAGCGTAGGGSNPGERTVLYSAIDDKMTRFDVDVAAATVTQRESVTLPSMVQYAWFHPSHRYVYAATSDVSGGSAAGAGKMHRLCALRVGIDGALTMHGEPQVLTSRPVNNSVDATGRYALTCYNNPANLTVHRINADGTLGANVAQDANIDVGIFAHQIRTTPNNRSVILVTRGVDASATGPEDPGALKIFRFDAGRLSPLADIRVGGRGGLGYGPRHLDFHPARPWAYVVSERQNLLYMHWVQGDSLAPEPSFTMSTLAGAQEQSARQAAGAIHVHPNGRTVYVSNRASATVDFNGRKVFGTGENNIAVYSLDPASGKPTLIQHAEPQGFHIRTFTIDPSGRLLIAATMIEMLVRDGAGVRRVPAGLNLFGIGKDGRLAFIRKYDLEFPSSSAQQLWVGMMALPTRAG